VLAEAGTAPLTPTIERTLMLAKTLPQPAEVPPNVTEALMTVLRSTVTNNTSVAVSTEALKLLFGGQPTVSDSWRETDPVAASLLADLVSQKTPLAEEALGYIARIRSANAVRRLLAQTDRPQQLRSLAIFWDKAGSLPGGVLPATQYVSALIWIGARQLIERPLWLLADYGAIAFGCGLALALFIYLTFRSPDFLSSRRIQNAIAIGLEFGVQLGVSGLVAYALAERLRIVSLAVRIITGTLVGGSVATLVFANFHHLYYDLPPQSPLLFPGALAFVAGFALAGPIRHIPIRVFLISLGVLVGVMATWYAYLNSGDDPLLYLYEDAVLSSWLIAILIAATIGIVSQFAAYANRRSTLSRMGIPKKFIKNSHL